MIMVRVDRNGYPELDLSVLLEPGVKFCVRCTEQQDAKNFVSAIMVQYPEKAGMWSLEDPKLRSWEEGNHLDLYPDLNNMNNWDELSWDDRNFAENHGYLIINFKGLPQITAVEDLGVFVPADDLLDDLLT